MDAASDLRLSEIFIQVLESAPAERADRIAELCRGVLGNEGGGAVKVHDERQVLRTLYTRRNEELNIAARRTRERIAHTWHRHARDAFMRTRPFDKW